MDKNKFTQAAAKLVQKGQLDKAIAEYQKARKADPKDVRILLKIGELQQKKGDNQTAAATLLDVAKSYAADGFFLKAVAVYKQIVKLDPDRVHVNSELADLYQQLGLLNDAMTQLQVVANHHEKSGDVAQALDVLRRMVDLDPDNVTSRIKLGELFAQQGQTKEALRELRVSAEHLKSHNRTDDYLRVGERIVSLAPEDLALSRELASLYLIRRDPRRALARLQANFGADPKDVATLDLLARAFLEIEQAPKAISVYKALAKVHREAERREEERAAWRKVLELAPGDEDAIAATSGAPPPPTAPRGPPIAAAPKPSLATTNRSAVPLAGGGAKARVSTGPHARVSKGPTAGASSGDKEKLPKLLTEIDVYLKYGLNEKAAAHVATVLALDPSSLDGLERAIQVHTALGNGAAAREAMIDLARACLEQGDLERGRNHLHRLIDSSAEHPEVEALIAAYAGGHETEAEEDVAPAPEASIVLDIEDEGGAEPRARFERSPEASPVASPPSVGTRGLEETAALEVPEGDEELFGAGAEDDEPLVAGEDLADEDEALVDDDVTDVAALALAVDDDEPLEVGGDDEADDDLLLVPDGDLDDDETLEDWGAEPVVLTEADVTAGPSAEGIASPKDAEVTAVAEMGVTVVAKVDIAVMAEMGVTAGPVGEDDSIASSPSDVRTEEEIVDDPWADSALEFDGTGDPPGLGHGEVSEIETELAEGVFFLEQGYVAEAQETFRAVLAKAPDHPLANDLLAEAVRREAEGTGVTDIEAPPPTVLHRLTPGPKVKITPNLFSHGPDSAFDLAAELASEIHSVGPPAQTKEEFQFSVEDVLAEFKRGVSQTVSVEDTDTHYDLGIAYKEMGLLADAVSEFAIARQGCVGKKKEIDCLTMAGMCEALQGHHDRAISTYLEALESTAVIPEAAKALHFEIGVSYEATGDLASANQHFRKVAAMDPAYRDVALAVARTETAIPPPAGRAKEGRGKL